MEKLVIIFGGTFALYNNHFEIFREIDKKFGNKVRRVNANKLITKIRGVVVEFLFCLNPTRDENYLFLKKSKEESGWKELVPLPSDELIKKINNPNVILLFGLCGGFQGNRGEYYIPNVFRKVFFKKVVKKDELSKIKISSPIKIKNIFSNKIKTNYKKIITSNKTLLPDIIEKKDKNVLVDLAKIFSKYAQGVEKESYPIVKNFRKSKLGVALMSSDIVSCKKRMMEGHHFTPNKKRFNNMVIKGIKIALEKP